jgi:hypothetical protein
MSNRPLKKQNLGPSLVGPKHQAPPYPQVKKAKRWDIIEIYQDKFLLPFSLGSTAQHVVFMYMAGIEPASPNTVPRSEKGIVAQKMLVTGV